MFQKTSGTSQKPAHATKRYVFRPRTEDVFFEKERGEEMGSFVLVKEHCHNQNAKRFA
jgi:hypothetical protein